MHKWQVAAMSVCQCTKSKSSIDDESKVACVRGSTTRPAIWPHEREFTTIARLILGQRREPVRLLVTANVGAEASIRRV
jgi:hypothetical protein